MTTSTHHPYPADCTNVYDLFTGKRVDAASDTRLIRLSPEYDGLCMLYTNSQSRFSKLYAMKILCWGLQADGQITGLVPWMDKLAPCQDLQDPFQGQWEGYYDPVSEQVFYEPPLHKALELENACQYFIIDDKLPEHHCIQEIPDTIGTHAMLENGDGDSLLLTEVLSWRLLQNGHVQAMLIDDEKVTRTPVLPGDESLYPVDREPRFRYYFQHHIANQIKAQDPEALAAIALLLHD